MIFKNLFIYAYLYKIRKKLFYVGAVFLFDILFSFFMSDMMMIYKSVELVMIKWLIYFLSFIAIFLIINTKKKEISKKDEILALPPPKPKFKEEVFTPREEIILNKKELKSRADLIIQKYKKI